MGVVTFVTGATSRSVDSDGSLLAAARRAGLPLASSCGGIGLCDACLVSVVAGAENLSPPNERELAAGLGPGERLACQAVVHGPTTVTTGYF